MENDSEIIEKIIGDYDLDLGEKFEYVGATIIKRSIFPQSTEILFCEDGFVDEDGVPYIMQANIPNGVYDRDRIIVFYSESGQRFLVPVDGDNWTLIGNDVPENVKNIDYGKAKRIIHRKTLELKREPERLSDDEIKELVKKYRKNYKKGRMLIAGVLMSFVWLIIIGLIVIFTIGGDENRVMSDGAILAVLGGGIIAWIASAIASIIFFISLPARRLKQFVYRSEFLVFDLQKDIPIKGVNESHISGYSYENDTCKFLTYGVSHYDVSFIEDVSYFEVVYRYSKTKYPRNLDFCLFLRK